MKRGRIILSLVSVFLIGALVIGNAGATIFIQNCNSCGVSINTVIFDFGSGNENSCCAGSDSCGSQDSSDNISGGCCKLTTENLKLTNYFPSKTFILSFFAEIQPVYKLEEVLSSEEQQIVPLFVHNKHGSGRNILITNRQLLI